MPKQFQLAGALFVSLGTTTDRHVLDIRGGGDAPRTPRRDQQGPVQLNERVWMPCTVTQVVKPHPPEPPKYTVTCQVGQAFTFTEKQNAANNPPGAKPIAPPA